VKCFDFKSLIVVIIIDVGFVIALALSIAVIYYFRNTQPTADDFQSYVKTYFKNHGRPPPFFNKIQHEMHGYCCGASSYMEYVEGNSDFFDIPHSCCFQEERERNPDCGKNEWKYLYMFLQLRLRKILDMLEKKFVDTDDILEVLLDITASDSQEFLQANYQAMLHDRESNIKKNMTALQYSQLEQEERRYNPNLDKNQLAAQVSQRVSRQAEAEVNELQFQFIDPKLIMFLPMGCLDLMDEIKTSKWKGFAGFKLVQIRVISTFEGILGMVICYFVLLIISTVVFNLKGHAIDRERRLTAFQVLHDEGTKEAQEIATVLPPVDVTDSEEEEEELLSLIHESQKTLHSLPEEEE
jgi:hypothetical protein